MDGQVIFVFIVLAFAVVMLVTEFIPLSVTSMIVAMALVVGGSLTAAQGFHGFVNSNVIIFFSMFVVGGALFETGAANNIGGIVEKFAKTERQAILIIMVVTAVMSAFLSNTGTAAVMIPVVIGISSKTGIARSRLLLPMAFASVMGGGLSLIGTPVNLNANAQFIERGYEGFGFFDFAVIGLPMTVLGIVYFMFIGYKFLPEAIEQDEDGFFDQQVDYSHVPKWKQIMSIVILALTVLAMIFENQIGIALHVSSTIGAISLVLFGVITEKQAIKSVDMSTIFLFGGTLALATALEVTGAGAILADAVIGLLGYEAPERLFIAVIVLLTTVMTQFMSNTATTALLAPIAFNIAISMGASPHGVLMATAVGGALSYATPVATPPLTMVVGIGKYKFMDFVKGGLPIIIIGFILSLILLPIFFPFFP